MTPASQTDPTVRLTAAPERNAPPRSSAFFRLLADSTVRNVLLSYFCLAFISTANDVILALWMFLDIKNAGLGLTVSLQNRFCSLGLTGTYLIARPVWP